MRSPGFVFVMAKAGAPQFVRVGRTEGSPEDSARQANLQLRDAAYFANSMAAEDHVHEALKAFHRGTDPEIFEAPVETALAALADAMERHVGTRETLPSPATISAPSTPFYEQAVRRREVGDAVNALALFRQAAQQNDLRAYPVLAEMCERGEGTILDTNACSQWMQDGARLGSRECWGMLADRFPQAHLFRGYFQGLEFDAMTTAQNQAAMRRLSAYLKAPLEPADHPVIEAALEQVDAPELHQAWQNRGRQRPQSKWNWVIAAALGVLLAGVLFKIRSIDVGRPQPAALEATEDSTPAQGTTQRAARPATARPKALKLPPASQSPDAHAPAVVAEAPPALGTPAPAEKNVISKLAAPAVPVPAMTGDELREQYTWGKEKADESFNNTHLKITDTIVKIGKRDISFRKIKCKLAGPLPDNLAPGMSATIEGVVHGQGFWTGTITLDECRVL